MNPRHLSKIALLACLLLNSGCTTYRYTAESISDVSLQQQSAFPVAMRLNQPYILEKNSASKAYHKAQTERLTKTTEIAVQSRFQDVSESHPLTFSPTLSLSLTGQKLKSRPASVIGTLLTFGAIPAANDAPFTSTLEVTSGGEVLFRSERHGEIRRYMAPIAFPFILPGSILFSRATDPEAIHQKMIDDMLAGHRKALDQWAHEEKEEFDKQLAGSSIQEQRQWLISNRGSLFYGELLERLYHQAPSQNALAWHRQNVEYFPDYASLLSAEQALWFTGPQGQRVIDLVDAVKRGESTEILAARVESNGPYKMFSAEESRRLEQSGLPSSLIAAMMRSTANHRAAASSNISTPKNASLARMLIQDNSGEYMNPWTSDGVLAEWVDKAINANMGSAIGSAAGAYAASKALETVPFVGGFLGSKVGKEVGRKAAIGASGGMEYIRATSDLSFRSLDDMARYLKAHYATESTFQDAIKAASAIYPGLTKALISAP